MPAVTRDGGRLYYESRGDGPVVLFVPTCGFGPWQWAWQHPAVVGPYTTVVYHPRGTGRSSELSPPETLETLVADLAAVYDQLSARRIHLIGFGVGGRVALEYTHTYDHVQSLSLLQTPAGDSSLSLHDPMTVVAPRDGLRREQTTGVLSSEFVTRHPGVVDQLIEWRRSEDAPIEYWQALSGLLQEPREWPLYTVSTPTCLFHGGADSIIPPAHARRLAEDLPTARAHIYEDARHLVSVERSRLINDTLVGFLEEQATPLE